MKDTYIQKLFERLVKFENYEKNPRILHVTEIISCPYVEFEFSEYNFAFLAGIAIHELIQNRIQKEHSDWMSEYPVKWYYSDYEIHGRIDLVNTVEKKLVEIKTGGFSFWHLYQIRFYLNKFPDFEGYLVYFRKMNSGKVSDNVRTIKVTNPFLDHEIEQLVENFLQKKGPPDERYCDTCYFKKKCPRLKPELQNDKKGLW